MGWINRLPRGLLSFLDTNTQGVNPAQLLETVTGNLDLEPFYRSLVRYENLTVTAVGAAASTQAASVFVPIDELWLLHGVSIQVNNTGGAVASNFRYTVRQFNPLTGATFLPQAVLLPTRTLQGTGFGISAGETFFDGQVFSRPFTCVPGAVLSLELGPFTGAASVDCAFSATINRMQI